jgi:hypothetical protein
MPPSQKINWAKIFKIKVVCYNKSPQYFLFHQVHILKTSTKEWEKTMCKVAVFENKKMLWKTNGKKISQKITK